MSGNTKAVPESATIPQQTSAPSLSDVAANATPQSSAPASYRRKPSKAWIYYAILSFLCLIAVFTSSPSALVGFFAFGAYAGYIYRGGRHVWWIW